MAYRRFYLVNSTTEVYNLTNNDKKDPTFIPVFFNEPTGLGFSQTITTIRLGDEEKKTSSSYSMPNPSGQIVFYDEERAYKDYYDFVTFLSHKPLQLYYSPATSETGSPFYYINCEVTSLSKGEIDHEDGTLRCDINFKGMSFWMSSKQMSVNVKDEFTNDGKYYDAPPDGEPIDPLMLMRPYVYSGRSLSDIEIFNKGNMETGFIFEANRGENDLIENPVLTIYDELGQNAYGIIKLKGTFSYIRINSNDTNQEIYLEDSSGVPVTNPINCQDFSNLPEKANFTFFKLKVGKSKAVFSAGSEFDGTLTFTWNDKFVSV